MSRILALDYGQKRTGIAVTDPLQMFGQALETVETKMLVPYLHAYFELETVALVIIGMPYNLDGSPTDNTERVEKFIARFKRIFTAIPIETVDETYTSKMAVQTMIEAGYKKAFRRKKGNIDKISAALMLQEYLRNR